MKVIKNTSGIIILRLDAGEEFRESVEKFCLPADRHGARRKIFAVWLSALGSAGEVELAYFNTKIKQYESKTFREFLEIVNITGNVSLKDGKPFCHAHGVFGRGSFELIGGHINRCVISATCEISLRLAEGAMKREFDEKTGLFLLN